MERRKRNSNKGGICSQKQVETVRIEGNLNEVRLKKVCVIISGFACAAGVGNRLENSQHSQQSTAAGMGHGIAIVEGTRMHLQNAVRIDIHVSLAGQNTQGDKKVVWVMIWTKRQQKNNCFEHAVLL